MKFDPATASLSPANVANNFADVVPNALAYRAAAGGTTVYVAQGAGGPQVQPLLGEGFSIDSSAKLIPLPGNPFLAGSNGESVAVHPSGNFVYFSQSVSNEWSGIGGYGLGANGVPQPLAGSPFYQHPIGSAMVIDPQGRFLFAMPLRSTEVYTFPVAGNGALGSPTVTTVSSSVNLGRTFNFLQASPDGKYLYEASGDTIAVLRIDGQTGTLSPVAGSPYSAGKQITSFAMSSDGKFLFASDCCTNTIQVFATNSGTTGMLTPASSVVPMDNAPHAVATQGHFVFVGTSISQSNFTGSTVTGSISVYALDSSTGTLTLKGNFPTPIGAEMIIAIP